MDNELMYYYDGLGLIAEDFYQKEHIYIYQAIKTLRTNRKTIDVVTVADQLNKDNLLDVV
jgi:replicative DNA helicase